MEENIVRECSVTRMVCGGGEGGGAKKPADAARGAA